MGVFLLMLAYVACYPDNPTMSIEDNRSYKEKEQTRRERQQVLAPLLARTMALSKDVYHELRPKAEYVADVPMDYPLRHQQVHGLSIGRGLDLLPVADYLMIALRNSGANRKQTLMIYRDDANPSGQRWDVDRILQTDDLTSQNTKMKEASRRPEGSIRHIDFEVSTFSYRPEYGHNAVIG
jgi:hypothetical protein